MVDGLAGIEERIIAGEADTGTSVRLDVVRAGRRLVRAALLPTRRMFIRHFTDATPQATGQSDLRRLFAYDPARSEHLLRFTQEVMRGPGPLPPGERELLAAMTSTENHCLF